jgi:alpha-galactosidase
VNGTATFEVWLDGVKSYDSGTMTAASPTRAISLNVTGKSQLRLIVTAAGDGAADDHADWADARLTCTAPPDAGAPAVVEVTPSAGASGVAVSATIVGTFSEAMAPWTITRSTVTLAPQGKTTVLSASVVYDEATARATLTPDSALDGTTTYTATIKGGANGVQDLAGNPLPSDRVWSFTTAAAPVPSYLSDRAWTVAANGYGPVERDRSNGEDLAGDGTTIALKGVPYAKGLGVHATAEVRYPLNAACTAFTAVVGVDDEVGANGSVAFQVWTDGVQRFDSGVMTGAMAGQSVAVNVTGANELLLFMTDGGDGSNYDHGDWADAQVTCGSLVERGPR